MKILIITFDPAIEEQIARAQYQMQDLLNDGWTILSVTNGTYVVIILQNTDIPL